MRMFQAGYFEGKSPAWSASYKIEPTLPGAPRHTQYKAKRTGSEHYA